MNPEDFVKKLQKTLIEENYKYYCSTLNQHSPEETKDAYWLKVLQLYHYRLTVEEKEILLEIIKQILVDTVSNMLGVLDGTCDLDGKFENLILKSEDNPEIKLNGYLQDYFIGLEERLQEK